MQHKFSRHIKLLICVTLYNEDQDTLGKTLLGICEVCVAGSSGVCCGWANTNKPQADAAQLRSGLHLTPCRTWRCFTGSMAAMATATAWTGRRLRFASSRYAAGSGTLQRSGKVERCSVTCAS